MKKSPLFVAALILLSLYFLIVRDDKVKPSGIKQPAKSFLEGVRMVHTKAGKQDWVVTAKRADITDSGNRAELSDIEVKVQEKGTSIVAEKGVYDMAGKKLSINGPITAKEKDYTITSENIDYENSTGILKTNGKVRIDSGRFSMSGTGLSADNNQRKVRILKDVQATFYN